MRVYAELFKLNAVCGGKGKACLKAAEREKQKARIRRFSYLLSEKLESWAREFRYFCLVLYRAGAGTEMMMTEN